MRKEAASELARGREGGRVARRCLSSISTRYVRERERESTKHAFHANYNAFPWRTNRLFCRHLSNNPPQFIWIGTLKGSAVPSDLSSQEDVALSQVAQNWSITSFNLFISCHSTFFDKKKTFSGFTDFFFLYFEIAGNTVSKRWHGKCWILTTTETERPRGTLTHHSFFFKFYRKIQTSGTNLIR